MYTKMPRLVSNSVTVFVHDDPQETARDAQEFFQQFPELKLLKIKLAGNENDVETALRIKEVAPDGMQFTLDANQGFKDPSKAVDILGKVKNVLENVDYIEEPCPKGELDMLAYVKNNIKNMWVIADESAATLADVEKIIAAKAAHGVNIKLEKAGGIWQGRQIAELCLKNNLKVMVGCMMERGIGIAAGIHFVASTPNVVFSDLDGDLYGELCTTPISPFIKGCRVPIEKPGFGIEPDLKLIEKAQKKGSVSFFNPHDSGVTT
jgi:L-alanine-DL-glutamate epimerase-like enolase superfamily enzyme